jgi:hypothetical protein
MGRLDAQLFPGTSLSNPTHERCCVTVNLASYIAIADPQGPPTDPGDAYLDRLIYAAEQLAVLLRQRCLDPLQRRHDAQLVGSRRLSAERPTRREQVVPDVHVVLKSVGSRHN